MRMTATYWRRVFPLKLEYCLKQRGMTQRELADKIGITEASMSRYANGNRIPKITTIVNMAYALGVSIEELI